MAADGSPWQGLMGLTESQQEDVWLWLTKEKER